MRANCTIPLFLFYASRFICSSKSLLDSPSKERCHALLVFHSSLQDLASSADVDSRLPLKTVLFRTRSNSTPGILARWICTDCHFFNSSVTFGCAVCNTVDHPPKTRIERVKEISLKMASSVTSREGNTTWHVAPPKTLFEDGSSKESKWDTIDSPMSKQTGRTALVEDAQLIEEGELADRIDDTPSRSPKRHSQSVYERVKSKVSRSLSNGSVVQKLWMDSSSNSMISKSTTGAGSGLLKRPTSMVDNPNVEADCLDTSRSNVKSTTDVCNQTNDEVNKNTEKAGWSCIRCTLDNQSSNDKCEACETPRKAPQNRRPRNGMVISVPDWIEPEVTEVHATTTSHSSHPSNRNSSKLSPSWNKPINRRSLSEISNNADRNKTPSNRRSMVETDTQGNISVRSSINNVNLQVPTRIRYSYIGLTEPTPSSTDTSRQPDVGQKKAGHSESNNSSTNTDSVALSSSSAQNSAAPQSSIPIPPTIDVSGLSLKRMWTCTKCSFAYNPLWSDRCDICNSVRSPPSVNEPSLITVTKDSVRYTPTKEEGDKSSGNRRVPAAGMPATLATEETDLEDDLEVLTQQYIFPLKYFVTLMSWVQLICLNFIVFSFLCLPVSSPSICRLMKHPQWIWSGLARSVL